MYGICSVGPPLPQHEPGGGCQPRTLGPHPSLKPQLLLRYLVRANLTLGEGTVLDTFAGSGSTLAPAQAIGYRAIGLEKNHEYVTLAAKAIPKLTSFEP